MSESLVGHSTTDLAKRTAAAAAAALVEPGMRVGLGTGSTVAYLLDSLADRSLDFVGLPTSEATAEHARSIGITLIRPDEVERLDLAIDGADELDRSLRLTKGGGGALLREKVVAAMADLFVVIATADKVVDRLAQRFPLPIEVVPFATTPVVRTLAGFGFEASPRDGGRYRTDNGNAIIDARMDRGLSDPAAWDQRIGMLPGVVTTGLFVDMAQRAYLGRDDGSLAVLEATP